MNNARSHPKGWKTLVIVFSYRPFPDANEHMK